MYEWVRFKAEADLIGRLVTGGPDLGTAAISTEWAMNSAIHKDFMVLQDFSV